jgi:alpha-methylacyl-CoA racemase
MLLVVGVLAAVIETGTSGVGQVIDAAMIDGAALLTTSMMGAVSRGKVAGQNCKVTFLTEAPPITTCISPRMTNTSQSELLNRSFFHALMDELGIGEEFPDQSDRTRWPAMRQRLTEIFRTRNT